MDVRMLKKLNFTPFIILISLIGLIFVIVSQRNIQYLDLSKNQSMKAPQFLKKTLNTIEDRISVTIFSSNQLDKELNLSSIRRWIASLSPVIDITVYDPVLTPGKADHYDITTDGVIIMEYQGKRLDIDLIEQIILNEGHSIEMILAIFSRQLLQLIQSVSPKLLIIHSSTSTLLDNNDPLGLTVLKQITDQNFLTINELNVNDLSELTGQYDLIIFYKLEENARKVLEELSDIFNNMPSVIIFNHPKFRLLLMALHKMKTSHLALQY